MIIGNTVQTASLVVFGTPVIVLGFAFLVLWNTHYTASLVVLSASPVGRAYCERMGGVEGFQGLELSGVMADGFSVRVNSVERVAKGRNGREKEAETDSSR